MATEYFGNSMSLDGKGALFSCVHRYLWTGPYDAPPPFSFVIVLSVLFLFTLLITFLVSSSFSLSFCPFHFTKEKGQKDKEKPEGPKEVIRSRK
jgi:hypothetical protein